MKNPSVKSLYDPYVPASPAPVMDGAAIYQHAPGGLPVLRNHAERLHPPPYPGSSVIPIYPVLSKNHNNYASMIVEPSGVPTIVEFDPDANPSPPFPPSITDGEMATPSGLNVRAEEIGLVLLVLLLWAGAVALFFNRWGKIRMLEPYQPKFIDAPRGSLALAAGNTGTPLVVSSAAPHRLSYPLIEFAHQPRLHHHSRLNIATGCCGDCATGDQQQPNNFPAFSSGRRRPSASPSSIFIHHHHPLRQHQGSTNRLSPGLPGFYGSGMMSGGGDPYQRPRQNSVVVFATAHFMTAARRVKSAMDLQTLVLREETEESVHALSCTGGGESGTKSGTMTASHSDNPHATITCV